MVSPPPHAPVEVIPSPSSSTGESQAARGSRFLAAGSRSEYRLGRCRRRRLRLASGEPGFGCSSRRRRRVLGSPQVPTALLLLWPWNSVLRERGGSRASRAGQIQASMGTSARWSATLRRFLIAIGQLDRVSGLGEESDLTADSCRLGRRVEASSSSLRCHAWRSGGCHLRSCFIRRIAMRRMPSPDWHRAEVILSSRLAFLPRFGTSVTRVRLGHGEATMVHWLSARRVEVLARDAARAGSHQASGHPFNCGPPPQFKPQAPSSFDTDRLAVKQEELDAGIDVNANYITQVDATNDVDGPPLCYKRKKPYPPLCHKHKKPLEYIHRPLTADSAPKYKVKEIHLKEGQSIVRGKPCVYHIDEFSGYCVWGNKVKLYNHNIRNLRKIIKNKKTPNYYYVATPGKRMAPAADNDDDSNVDLFGTEEEKKAVEEHAAKVKGSCNKKEYDSLYNFTMQFLLIFYRWRR